MDLWLVIRLSAMAVCRWWDGRSLMRASGDEAPGCRTYGARVLTNATRHGIQTGIGTGVGGRAGNASRSAGRPARVFGLDGDPFFSVAGAYDCQPIHG